MSEVKCLDVFSVFIILSTGGQKMGFSYYFWSHYV